MDLLQKLIEKCEHLDFQLKEFSCCCKCSNTGQLKFLAFKSRSLNNSICCDRQEAKVTYIIVSESWDKMPSITHTFFSSGPKYFYFFTLKFKTSGFFFNH